MSADGSSRSLQARFEDLAKNGGELIPGITDFSRGLGELLRWLDERYGVKEGEDHQIYAGLEELAARLEVFHQESSREAKPQRSAPPTLSSPGLEQFIETFRKEAQNRVQGLSISLMGVFGGLGSEEAMEQSAGHLHAIRGGAGMLGFEQVAGLAQLMERTILEQRRLQPAERQWPTRILLRAFAILQDAVQSPQLLSEAGDVELIFEALGGAAPLNPPPGPAERSLEEAARSSEIDVEMTLLEKPILVVDDVEAIAASVGFILSELEVPIELARDGEEALQMLQDAPFSLVISDVAMPRMDGITLTRRIRASQSLQHLPVILLTGLDHPKERQAGLEAGATAYLIKGTIGGGELLSTVRELLEVAPFVERPIPQEHRRILVAEDTETVAASIAFVLSEGPFEIILARDGEDAYQHLQKEEFDLLITDMQMPYMCGIELTRAIRNDKELRELPIIMLTGVQDDLAIQEAISAGIDRYLVKGQIAGEGLLDIVEDILE